MLEANEVIEDLQNCLKQQKELLVFSARQQEEVGVIVIFGFLFIHTIHSLE